MTPKEKATELVNKYIFLGNTVNSIGFAKQCALIAVDEILNNNKKIPGILGIHIDANSNFWNEVKQEIEKL